MTASGPAPLCHPLLSRSELFNPFPGGALKHLLAFVDAERTYPLLWHLACGVQGPHFLWNMEEDLGGGWPWSLEGQPVASWVSGVSGLL